ncbi:TIGR00255 family protein [Cyclobacterium lianum]|uniref:TIGR00255 family protein n=2 Tax=Cyclobacterium lianum TaxID=388280 RepID=A0A1M7PWS9_9BACT|nr:TIGR00255 family protein [Cyclobacterium lianum]
MTGFGLASYEDQDYAIQVEIKTLNSKFLDLSFRTPKQFSDKETEVKTMISAVLERGKVNVTIDFLSKKEDELPILIQDELFEKYYRKYGEMADAVGASASELFKLALQSPNVILSNNEKSDAEASWKKVKGVLSAAIADCDDFRRKEGEVLLTKFRESLESIEASLNHIQELLPRRKERLVNKIKNNFSEWVKEQAFDENRFEQELIYYFEKLDISEEIVRLDAHLKLFANVLDSGRSEGKKMGFVSQEMGREINTIGSKANDAAIQHHVIAMKDELEKIKEQALNIL